MKGEKLQCGLGKIYLKIKNTSTVDLLSFPTISQDTNNLITSVFIKYGVTEIRKPFVVFNTPAFDRTYEITYTDVNNTNCFLNYLSEIDFVEYVEKKAAVYTLCEPNDYHFTVNHQQYLKPGYLNIDASSNIYKTPLGTGTIVAVVDDAVLTTHEDLLGNIYSNDRDVADGDGFPDPPNSNPFAFANGNRFSHGTHVAGIAGAVTDNTIGVSSIGWSNRIMGVKTSKDDDFSDNLPFAYDGIAWAAANGARVINCSFGGGAPDMTKYIVLEQAKQLGAMIVAAAGNYGGLNPFYPAAHGEAYGPADEKLVIAVASIDLNNQRSDWGVQFYGPSGSNYGSWIDISAYGTNILSTNANSDGAGTSLTNQYGYKTGTSMAAPQVSAVAGLMRSQKPLATVDEIYDCLVYSANQDIYPLNDYGTLGFGRLDPAAALSCNAGIIQCNVVTENCQNPGADPIAIIIPSSQQICNGVTETLTASPGGISYLWSVPPPNNNTQTIPVTQPGTYSVTVTYPGGCTATASYSLPAANIQASVTLIENSGLAPNDGFLCGDDMILQLYCSPGISYQWSAFNPHCNH